MLISSWYCSSTIAHQALSLILYTAPELTTLDNSSGTLLTGAAIDLTCTTSEGQVVWRVRKSESDEYVQVTDVDFSVPTSADGFTITVTVGTNDGDYDCIVEDLVGTAVSKSYGVRAGSDFSAVPPSINTFDLSYGSESGLDNSEIRTVPFGEEITVSCGFTSGASASWYVNGQKMEATSGDAQSSTLTTVLEVGGVYQCRVADNSTGLSAVESFTLFGAGNRTTVILAVSSF